MRGLVATATLIVLGFQTASSPDVALLAAYVRAMGGEGALRAVHTRITEGTFDNGRGLRVPFAIYEKAPNKRATVISKRPIGSPEGSGRGYDGAAGWDKSFIGTGLRSIEGSELVDLAHESDMLRSLHLANDCRSTRIDEADGPRTILRCDRGSRPAISFHFNTATGLLVRHEAQTSSERGVTTHLEDYRSIDGLRLPFKTRIVGPGFTITYIVERMRHNEQIDDRMFVRPSQ